MSEKHKVLVIDDEPRHRKLYSETLKKSGFFVEDVSSTFEAGDYIKKNGLPDMIVSDVRMKGKDGMTFMKQVKEKYPELPFLIVTAFADIRDAVDALKLGAVDYLEKPVDLDELSAAVCDTLNFRQKQDGDTVPVGIRKNVVAESEVMKIVLRDAYRVAASDATVLLTGESGTGKEVISRFIHNASNRIDNPFIAVNCAAIPANLLASELFGHKKGAFTGAVSDRNGVFKEAAGGTLFLDEIGEMPIDLQPALLRVIETGKISPVGGDRELSVDFRLIAATNRNLEEEVKAGRFREDLFYRLNVFAFELPPLRRRKEDIMPMARYFLALRGSKSKRFSQDAARLIQSYAWPGNARELANAIERACILTNTEVILPEHLPASLVKYADEPRAIIGTDTDMEVRTIEEVEKDAILSALKRTNDNRTKAAELLGISRRTLVYKLKRMGINE